MESEGLSSVCVSFLDPFLGSTFMVVTSIYDSRNDNSPSRLVHGGLGCRAVCAPDHRCPTPWDMATVFRSWLLSIVLGCLA